MTLLMTTVSTRTSPGQGSGFTADDINLGLHNRQQVGVTFRVISIRQEALLQPLGETGSGSDTWGPELLHQMDTPTTDLHSNVLGFKHRKVTPLWPRANGEVERFVKTLKKCVKAAKSDGKNWRKEMQAFLRNYCTSPHATTGVAPSTLFLKPFAINYRNVRALVQLLR